MSTSIELIVLSAVEARPLYSLASTYVYVHPSCGDVPEDLLEAMRIRGASIVDTIEAMRCPRITCLIGNISKAAKAKVQEAFETAQYFYSAQDVRSHVNLCDYQSALLQSHGRALPSSMPVSDPAMTVITACSRPDTPKLAKLRSRILKGSATVRGKSWAYAGYLGSGEDDMDPSDTAGNEDMVTSDSEAVTDDTYTWYDEPYEPMMVDKDIWYERTPDLDGPAAAPVDQLVVKYRSSTPISLPTVQGDYTPHTFPSASASSNIDPNRWLSGYDGAPGVITAFGPVAPYPFPSFATAFSARARARAQPAVPIDHLSFFSALSLSPSSPLPAAASVTPAVAVASPPAPAKNGHINPVPSTAAKPSPSPLSAGGLAQMRGIWNMIDCRPRSANPKLPAQSGLGSATRVASPLRTQTATLPTDLTTYNTEASSSTAAPQPIASTSQSQTLAVAIPQRLLGPVVSTSVQPAVRARINQQPSQRVAHPLILASTAGPSIPQTGNRKRSAGQGWESQDKDEAGPQDDAKRTRHGSS